MTVALCTAACSAETPAPLRLLTRYEIGGEGGYDYIRFEPEGQRLFVAHGKKVEVLDARSGRKLGEIAPTNGVHGIALAPGQHHGFTTNGLDRSVTMFDLATLAPLKVIKYTGAKPDALEYDPATQRVFVANGDPKLGGDLTVIDAASGDITATVDLGGKLEGMAFDGRGQLFVAAEDRSTVHVVDTRTLARLAEWPLAPGAEPTGAAIDAAHHRLFLACSNRTLVVLDSDNGKVIASAPIGEGTDGAAFDPATSRVFTSNREGTLSVVREVSPDKYEVEPAVTTEAGARTVALDEQSHRLYLPVARFAAGSRTPVAGTFSVLVVGP